MKHCLLITLTALGFFTLGGCSTPAQDRAKLKEEIKREILAELRQQRQTPVLASSQQDREEMKKEIEREILAKVQNQVQTITSQLPDANDRAVQWQRVPVGSAEGHILRNGKGLQGCQVKLVRMLELQSIIEMFSVVREGAQFTTVTDEDGKYHFDRLPVGAYKLKWQLPQDKGWIRRLRDKPDAIITEGQTAVLKSVETSRGLVAH
jgi:hypothetical protein